MDRRSFLRRAGTLSAAVGATALIGATEACGTPSRRASGGTSTTATSTSTTASAHPGSPPNWSTLAAALTGSLVLPGDAPYAADALVYNSLFTPHPAAIAYCATASDVQRCVAFARDHSVALAARSGGHSYGGYSSGPGLVIDVSPLHAVTVSAGANRASAPATATVGAGATLLEVYSQLGAQGLLLPGGSCPTVGIAGLALGGGIGVFGRAYGLTSDNIASLTVVTADGTLRVCAPGHNPDLYWASRGGGGGNFGVVTSFTFTTFPIPAVNLFTLEWPWGAAPAVLGAWLSWIAAAPDELWANCQLLPAANSGGLMKVTGVFAGSTAACASALAPLLSAVPDAPSFRFVGPETYLNAMLIEAGCEGLPVARCSSPRYAFAAKSSYLTAPLPDAGTAAVLQAAESLPTTVSGVGGGIVFDGYGGAINRVAPGETAFVHRNAVACAQYSVSYDAAPPAPTVLTAAAAWLAQTHDTFSPYADGSYQNYIDPTLPDWAQAYYGSNLTRLRQIKARYDPDDLFHFAQSIPLPT